MKNNTCIREDANIVQINHCKNTILTLDDSFELLSSALNLAGNKVRLQILYFLSKEEKLCVCDLSDILSMQISAISQHLRKLKDRGIIKPTRNKQTIFYSLIPKYEDMFSPFFNLIDNDLFSNKMLETNEKKL